MDIATCCEAVHQIRISEAIFQKNLFPGCGFDQLHHVMQNRGLAATIAPYDYRAAISQCDGDNAYVKVQLEIVGCIL